MALIENNKIKAGEKLPSEFDLQNKYQASRDTIRKALLLLSQNGYIQKSQGKSSIVLDINRFNFPVSGLTSFKEIASDIKGKVEKTGKNSWIFGNYLTIFNVHAIISNCADYIPRNFPCVSGGCPRVDRACFPGKGDWRETVRQSDPGWTGPAGISGLRRGRACSGTYPQRLRQSSRGGRLHHGPAGPCLLHRRGHRRGSRPGELSAAQSLFLTE